MITSPESLEAECSVLERGGSCSPVRMQGKEKYVADMAKRKFAEAQFDANLPAKVQLNISSYSGDQLAPFKASFPHSAESITNVWNFNKGSHVEASMETALLRVRISHRNS